MSKVTLNFRVPKKVLGRATAQAAGAGLTLDEMVKKFLTDVADYDSPNHATAMEWAQACTASEMPKNTFLQYLASNRVLDVVLDLHDFIQDCLSSMEINEPEDQIWIREDIAQHADYLRRYYYYYANSCKEDREDKTLAAAMARILEWRKKKWEMVKQQARDER